MIVSNEVFMWIATAAVVGICVGWGARDVYVLRKHWKNRAEHHDEVFGAIIGLIIMAVGLVGALKFHGVLL